ncbi:hypothetical protein [Mycolicibacterium bacteremicum]|uniref:hypothetical protein n=1 Tax=Mycolicibacterium bacteremicum TaxID=564198 RepID=UPI0026EBD60D|nr:hypothetical protein [Mycolicibacterium bacteremicum]
MTATRRRFAAAIAAAVMPLTAVAIATAAPSGAETTCNPGQVNYNGACVDNCKRNEVRNSGTGECQTLLAAALDKAETPAVAKLTPDQLGGAWQLANNLGALPRSTQVWNSVVNTVDTVVGWPTLITAAAADTAATLAFFGLLPGTGAQRIASPLAVTGQTFAAASDVARVATSVPSLSLPKLPQFQLPPPPPIGLPELPAPPKIGAPQMPKIGMPRIGPPKLGASGICGPKLLFFRPCL